jgi:hypothetical protein
MISDAFVYVNCDACDWREEIELTALAGRGGYDTRNVVPKLKKSGWQIDGDDCYCPECVEDGKVPGGPTP